MLADVRRWIHAGRNWQLAVLIVTFFVYFAELSNRTYHSDYYQELGFAQKRFSSFTVDNRFLAEVVRYYFFQGFVADGLPMLVGLLCLCGTGFVMVKLVNVSNPLVSLAACLVVSLNPMFLETFMYPNTALITPLAILLAASAALLASRSRTPAMFFGCVGLLLGTLQLYQTSVFVFCVLVALKVIHDLSDDVELRAIWKFLGFTIGAVVVAVVLNQIFVKLAPIIWSERSGSRISHMLATIGTPRAAIRNLIFEAKTVVIFYSHDSFFFGRYEKWLLAVLYAATSLILVNRAWKTSSRSGRMPLLVVCLAVFPLLPNIVYAAFSDQDWFCYYRMMFPHVFVMAGVILLGSKAGPWIAKFAVVCGLFFAATATVNVNNAHQFLALKNAYDLNLSRNIADRVLMNPAYSPRLPLVLVGVIKRDLPFKSWFPETYWLDTDVCGIRSTGSSSVFALDWSKHRLMKAYLAFRQPTTDQTNQAYEIAKGRPVWPDPGSTFIENGIIIQVLSHDRFKEYY